MPAGLVVPACISTVWQQATVTQAMLLLVCALAATNIQRTCAAAQMTCAPEASQELESAMLGWPCALIAPVRF